MVTDTTPNASLWLLLSDRLIYLARQEPEVLFLEEQIQCHRYTNSQLGPCHIFSLELEIMVSHSEQEGRSWRCALGLDGAGGDSEMLGQGRARLEESGAWV